MINREDMLELSRRMTSKRTHLVRVAGAYIDDEGYIDGTFNVNFGNLKGAERERCLNVAKTIPFSKTNKELISYKMPLMKKDSVSQLIYALRENELKNDALLLLLYEQMAEQHPIGVPYAIYVYYGVYDVPVKMADKYRMDESEEVYRYCIVAVGPYDENQEFSAPEAGFLYPAFSMRSTDVEHINVYEREGTCASWLEMFLGLK